MKKLISFALVLALALSLSVAVSAANIGVDNGTATQDVTVAVVTENGTAVAMEEVYSVTVTFETLRFNYKANITESEKLTWDPATHTYLNEENVAVTYTTPKAITNAIEVKNHSNVKLHVTAAFAGDVKSATVNGVTATISENDTDLESAAVAAYGDPDLAPSTAYTLTPSGQPEILNTTNNVFDAGTITVSIAKVAAE